MQSVVGTTETQTLTNKTLTAPTINAGTVYLLTALTVAQDTDVGNYKITAKIIESDVPQGTAPFIVASTTVVTNLNADLLDGKEGPTGSIVGTSDSQVLTNKTLTSPILNTGISGDAFLDEDNLASDSATKAASQQSIKAYIDTQEALYDDELESITAAEAQQLQNIGTSTISAAQWGYLGAMDQSVSSASAPTFAGITINGAVAGTGFKDEDDLVSDSATAVASQQSIKAYIDGSRLYSYVGAANANAATYVEFTGLTNSDIYMIEGEISSTSLGSTRPAKLVARFNNDFGARYIWSYRSIEDAYPGGFSASNRLADDTGYAEVIYSPMSYGQYSFRFQQQTGTYRVFMRYQCSGHDVIPPSLGTASVILLSNGYATWSNSETLTSLRLSLETGNMTGTFRVFKLTLP